jgi:hypothetical protein
VPQLLERVAAAGIDPGQLPSWPTMIEIAIPVMNPDITAFDIKFEIQPIRARPATTKTTPVVIA